ncbi:MAG: hypothetical protein JO345_11125 [Streptosporangiaceae bacterium]|nr:hypothetical protein [Streptosporangiaceae bacterium]
MAPGFAVRVVGATSAGHIEGRQAANKPADKPAQLTIPHTRDFLPDFNPEANVQIRLVCDIPATSARFMCCTVLPGTGTGFSAWERVSIIVGLTVMTVVAPGDLERRSRSAGQVIGLDPDGRAAFVSFAGFGGHVFVVDPGFVVTFVHHVNVPKQIESAACHGGCRFCPDMAVM